MTRTQLTCILFLLLVVLLATAPTADASVFGFRGPRFHQRQRPSFFDDDVFGHRRHYREPQDDDAQQLLEQCQNDRRVYFEKAREAMSETNECKLNIQQLRREIQHGYHHDQDVSGYNAREQQAQFQRMQNYNQQLEQTLNDERRENEKLRQKLAALKDEVAAKDASVTQSTEADSSDKKVIQTLAAQLKASKAKLEKTRARLDTCVQDKLHCKKDLEKFGEIIEYEQERYHLACGQSPLDGEDKFA